jgi:choline monooxygenase
MWWIQKTAISHESVAINVGYCFPEETISRSDFESVSKLYFERLDQVIKEDDLITEYQQHGLHADFQGFYTIQESTVLQLDKEIIARTIGWL